MASRIVPICLRPACAKEIVYDPKLGNLNAGPVQVLFGAEVVGPEDLCAECMKELRDWLGPVPVSYEGGLVQGVDRLKFLPVVGTVAPADRSRGQAPTPPMFAPAPPSDAR